MDKIREEFEHFIEIQSKLAEGEIYDFMEKLKENKVIGFGFYGGYKSRDEEINDRKLECIDYQETIIKQQAAIQGLRKTLEEIHEATRHGYNALFAAKIAEKALKD